MSDRFHNSSGLGNGENHALNLLSPLGVNSPGFRFENKIISRRGTFNGAPKHLHHKNEQMNAMSNFCDSDIVL